MPKLLSVTAQARVFPEGQKITGFSLMYDCEPDPALLSTAAFTITDRSLEPALPAAGMTVLGVRAEGRRVELKTGPEEKAAWAIMNYTHEGRPNPMGPPLNRPKPAAGGPPKAQGGLPAPGGPDPKKMGYTGPKPLCIEIAQRLALKALDGQTIPPCQAVCTQLSCPETARFELRRYKNLPYQLFIPAHYRAGQSYPLVLFIPDASARCIDPSIPLCQGIGGVVWACPEDQAKHPCFVVCPAFGPEELLTHDDFTCLPRLYDVKGLLDSVASQYSIDPKRIYTTGQSMGCMASCELMCAYPDYFAGAVLVAGQWDPERCGAAMARQNLWIMVSENDLKAHPGMDAVTAAIEKNGGTVARLWWDASRLEALDELAREAVETPANVYYTVFRDSSVGASRRGSQPWGEPYVYLADGVPDPRCAGLAASLQKTGGLKMMKEQPLYAGMGHAQVEIDPSWLPMEHFGGVHDAPCARALLLKASQGEFLLLSLELTSLIGDAAEEFKAAAASAAGISPERVWVSVTHTFAVPHFLCGPALANASPEEIHRGGAYKAAFLAAARAAVSVAARSLRPARLSLGSGASAVNANRDMETPQGWWIGINRDGLCDRTLDVLRVDGEDGGFIGQVYHYAMQSSVLDHVSGPDGTSLITADLVGETSRLLEQRRGGTAIFLPGASGDQCPRERARYDALSADGTIETVDLGQEKGFEIIARLGGELACDVERALGQADTPVDALSITMVRQTFPCPKQVKQFEGFPAPTLGYRSVPDGVMDTTVELVRIGGSFAAVGVLPELNCTTGLDISRQSPVPVTWVAQMINGGQKYMVDAASFERGTYGAMNGFFDKGAAEELVRQIRRAWAETF